MPTAQVTHDLTISDTDGSNKRGFILIRDRSLLRRYRVTDAETIAARLVTDKELTEADAPPQLRQRWFAEGWPGGIGGINSRSHNKWLATSIGIDTSEQGFMRPAPQLVAATNNDTAPTAYIPSGLSIVGTEVWLHVGRDLYQWDYANQYLDNQKTPQTAAVLYRSGVEFAGNTFVPCWQTSDDEPTNYIYKADADSNWSVISSGTGDSFKYFAKTRNVNGTEILVGGNEGGASAHMIRTSTDPTSLANWSSQTEIGDSDSPITALVEGNNNEVLVAKTNGLWSFSRSGIVENLTPEVEFAVHPDNFRGAHNWNGHILLPFGNGGMWALIGNRLVDVSLRWFMPRQSQFHGRVCAIHGTPDHLYALVHEAASARYHLLQAHWEQVAGDPEDYHWHHMGTVSYTTGTDPDHVFLRAEGIPGPSGEIHHRAWVGVESAGSNLLPYYSPNESDDEFAYSNDAGNYAQTVLDDRGFRNIEKAYQSIDIVHNNLGTAGRQWTVKYSIDGAAYATDLADSGGNEDGVIDGTGRSSTLTFPDGTSGKTLELQFVPASTGNTSTPPEIESFSVVSQLRPDPLKLLPLTLYLADDTVLLNGGIATTTKGDLAQLRTWDAQAGEVLVVDPEGTSRNMVILPNTFNIQEVSSEPGRRREYVVTLVLAEV